MGKLTGFFAHFERETVRFFTVPNRTIVPGLVSIFLYILIFGIGLGKRISGDGSYLEFFGSVIAPFFTEAIGRNIPFITPTYMPDENKPVVNKAINSLCKGGGGHAVFSVGFCVSENNLPVVLNDIFLFPPLPFY